MEIKLKEIRDKFGGEIIGDENLLIIGVASLEEASEGEITFVANSKYKSDLNKTKASVVVLRREMIPHVEGISLLIVNDPYYTFGQLITFFHKKEIRYKGVSNNCIIGKDVKLGKDLTIEPFVTICDKAKIGERVTIYPFVYIGENSEISDDTIIYPNVSIRENVYIGKRVIIHSGTVIGSDGYGFATHEGHHHKIPQIGTVIIEDDVELGANVTIDRATLDKTIVKKGTKIDNLVHIAHNVSIGEDSLIIAQVGISGSSKIGKSVVLAGQVGVSGHVEIGNNVVVAAKSGITKDIESNQVVSGYPAVEHKKWLKSQAMFLRLPEIKDELDELKREIMELKMAKLP